MEREASATGNKGIVTIAKGQNVHVAQISGNAIQGLAGHANELVSIDQNELRIPGVVGLNRSDIPCRTVRSDGERIVRWRPGSQESVIASMDEHGGEVELLDVPEAIEP